MIRSLILVGVALTAGGQDAPQPQVTTTGEAAPERIAWYTSLDDALAEARRTNRPVLVHAAAPQCSGVPGMW